jgi:hypothetical protein
MLEGRNWLVVFFEHALKTSAAMAELPTPTSRTVENRIAVLPSLCAKASIL